MTKIGAVITIILLIARLLGLIDITVFQSLLPVIIGFVIEVCIVFWFLRK